MPLKPTGARAKRARKEGVPLMLKDVDAGEAGGLSAHAAKKPRHNAVEAMPTRRTVSRRAAPGEGKGVKRVGLSSRGPGKGSLRRDVEKKLDFVDAKQARALRNAELVKVTRKVPKSMHASTVQGRKKPPSQMHVKRKGGPRKRLRLHGG